MFSDHPERTTCTITIYSSTWFSFHLVVTAIIRILAWRKHGNIANLTNQDNFQGITLPLLNIYQAMRPRLKAYFVHNQRFHHTRAITLTPLFHVLDDSDHTTDLKSCPYFTISNIPYSSSSVSCFVIVTSATVTFGSCFLASSNAFIIA